MYTTIKKNRSHKNGGVWDELEEGKEEMMNEVQYSYKKLSINTF